jgi:hypothetical protein
MMVLQDCSSIRDSLLSYIGEQTDVVELRDTCVITLPLRTVDDRWIDVYVEKRAADFYLVHDAGKTLTELISHGLRMTESKMNLLSGIADRFGAHIAEGAFTVGCKIDGVQAAIMAIGQCASLGMLDLLKHSPNFAQIPLISIVGKQLDVWATDKALVSSRVEVEGQNLQHTFDFVCHPFEPTKAPIAITILKPSYTPMSHAKLYGYMVFDLSRTKCSRWKRVAILDKGSEWTPDSIELLEKHAQKVLSVSSAEDADKLQTELPRALDQLLAAA